MMPPMTIHSTPTPRHGVHWPARLPLLVLTSARSARLRGGGGDGTLRRGAGSGRRDAHPALTLASGLTGDALPHCCRRTRPGPTFVSKTAAVPEGPRTSVRRSIGTWATRCAAIPLQAPGSGHRHDSWMEWGMRSRGDCTRSGEAGPHGTGRTTLVIEEASRIPASTRRPTPPGGRRSTTTATTTDSASPMVETARPVPGPVSAAAPFPRPGV